MDLVRQLRDVRFETAVRGYDYAGVDTFLATLRSDVADLQERYEAAQAKLASLEADGPSEGASSQTEGELRRTLVLAQRLADETEADAKASADELVSAATQHAETTRAEAEAEAAEMRAAAEQELAAANEEAEALRQGATEEAEQANAESRLRAEALLVNAEAASEERVAEIEALAQNEVATMREPVREEITQLEDVRSRLLGDISDLEAHLEAQRVRVRTAVEALRVGMSGSIQDLERVADNDALMAPEPSPGHSNVSGADVAAAPDVEIQESVAAQAASTAPTVDDLASETEAPQHATADGAPDVDTEPIAMVDDVELAEVTPDVVEATEFEADLVPEVMPEMAEPEVPEVLDVEMPEMVEPEVPEVPDVEMPDVEMPEMVEPGVAEIPEVEVDSMPEVVVEDAGMAAPIAGVVGGAAAGAVGAAAFSGLGSDDVIDLEATQAMPAVDDLEQADLVELDDEPDALFGTDVGADAEMADAEGDGEPTSSPADVAAGSEGFVAKFAASLDQLPIER